MPLVAEVGPIFSFRPTSKPGGEDVHAVWVKGWFKIVENGFFLLGGCLGSTYLAIDPVDT